MTFIAEPSGVPGELVAMTRRIGHPDADLVVLAEGNASARIGDRRFAITASGARMEVATVEDFLVGDLGDLVDVLDGDGTSQEQLTDLLSSSSGSSESFGARRASIETLVHVAALSLGATWVAHTHPTAVLGLLAMADAEASWAAPLFPDEAVVIGEPVWVPYAEPGIALGRAVYAAIRRRRERDGHLPRLVLLGNHGIVALGSTAAEVEAVSEMAVKAARVRSIAMAAGRPVALDQDLARALADRPDEVARRSLLG